MASIFLEAILGESDRLPQELREIDGRALHRRRLKVGKFSQVRGQST